MPTGNKVCVNVRSFFCKKITPWTFFFSNTFLAKTKIIYYINSLDFCGMKNVKPQVSSFVVILLNVVNKNIKG